MKLSPGDTIQIILTVGGVPYVKTWNVRGGFWEQQPSAWMCQSLFDDLCDDIDSYADETE